MNGSTTDWIQAIAALLTMCAALAALVIAARAPRAAAQFAEEYRRKNAAEDERQKLRMSLAAALMACRAELLNADARRAINLVDYAFADVPNVLEARRLFLAATSLTPPNPSLIVERYHGLIEAVARAMGTPFSITSQDIRSGYYPDAMSRIDEATLAEAEEKIARRAAMRDPYVGDESA